MMWLALIPILISQCAHIHADALIENTHTSTTNDSGLHLDVENVSPVSNTSLGYNNSHVLLKGPVTAKILDNSKENPIPVTSETSHLATNGGRSYFVPGEISPIDETFGYNNAHILSKAPSYPRSLQHDKKTNGHDIDKDFQKDSKDTQFQNQDNGIASSVLEHTATPEHGKKVLLTKAKSLDNSTKSTWPSSSYSSASSWAGGYGRPTQGAANAQASASAGGSTASSSSGSSSGSGSSSYGSGSGSGGYYNGYYGGGSGSNSGPTSHPASGFGGNSNSGSLTGSSALAGSGTFGGSMSSGGSQNNAGTSSSSGLGSYSGGYFKPVPQNTGTSAGGSANYNMGYTGGYNRPFIPQTSGQNTGATSSASGAFSGSNNAGAQTGNFYVGYKPTSSPNTVGTGSFGATGSTSSSGTTGYQGSYNRPSGSTTGSSSTGSSGYQTVYNRPMSGSYSGSTTSAGTGPYSGYSTYYGAYNKPSTTSSGVYAQYNKPSSNNGPITPTTSGGAGGYYGIYNRPTVPGSANNQVINNKPPPGSSSGTTGAYYNGYYITTSPNSGTNINGISNNGPFIGGSKPSTGTGIASNTGFAGSSSGASGGLGFVSGSVNGASGSNPTLMAVIHIPWWLQAGVFSSAAINGSVQGITGGGVSSSTKPNISNIETGSIQGIGSGGGMSGSSSGFAGQGTGSTSGLISGPVSPSGSSSGFVSQGIGPTSGFISGSGSSSGSSSGFGSQGVGPTSGFISGAGSTGESSSSLGNQGVGPTSGFISGSSSGSSSGFGGQGVGPTLGFISGAGSTGESSLGLGNQGVVPTSGSGSSSGSSSGFVSQGIGSTSGFLPGSGSSTISTSGFGNQGIGTTSGLVSGSGSSSGSSSGLVGQGVGPTSGFLPESGSSSGSSSGFGNQGIGPTHGFIGPGSSSGSLVGSEIHGGGLPSGPIIGVGTTSESGLGFQTNQGSSSLGGINNVVGVINQPEMTNQINTSSGSLVGLGTTTGSIIGPGGSTGGVSETPLQPGITSGTTHYINGSSGTATNTGTVVILPWWFLTGVFSGSVDRPISSATSSNSVITVPQSFGPGNNNTGPPYLPITIVGALGSSSSSGSDPANNLVSLPSGELGPQNQQTSHPNLEPSVGVGPTSVTSGSSSGTTSGFVAVAPIIDQGNHPTGEVVTVSQPGVPSEGNFGSNSASVVGTASHENLSNGLNVGSEGGIVTGSQPQLFITGSMSSGSGNLPLGIPTSSLQPEIPSAENTPINSGLVIGPIKPGNLPSTVNIGGIHMGSTHLVEAQHSGLQSGISTVGIFPASLNPGPPSVSDIAITSRPQGWSGGNNGPATVIGYFSRPTSGSGATSSSFTGGGNILFPYRVNEEEPTKFGTVSVPQTPWWLSVGRPFSDPSKRHHTVFNDKPTSEKDEENKKSKTVPATLSGIGKSPEKDKSKTATSSTGKPKAQKS